MRAFMDRDFFLTGETARRLYHEYASSMPICDYHCHVPPAQIAQNTQFANLTHVWLGGDHYKWRAMRTAGIDERYITGDADDWEKFQAWARTVPQTIGNPLYHWTHMELQRVFGIDTLLNPENAREIYDQCNELLATESFRVRGLINRFHVTVLCTTDDPTDSLASHREIAEDDSFPVQVLPTWRPDKAHALEHQEAYGNWISRLEEVSGLSVTRYEHLIEALHARHTFFHANGCRLSDHGLTSIPAQAPASSEDLSRIFDLALRGRPVSDADVLAFRAAVLMELARMDYDRGWTMQLHLGALRNVNTRMFRSLGADTGFDVIGDWPVAEPLARFLDSLSTEECLPKTIVYVLNPKDNEVVASIIGAFQGGDIPGRIQFGSGWWFNDQKDGMIRQMTALSSMGLLSRFIGMLTDSRSFLSYPRHEYFRRLLCSIIGEWADSGEVPCDMQLLGETVQNIAYRNVINYLGISAE